MTAIKTAPSFLDPNQAKTSEALTPTLPDSRTSGISKTHTPAFTALQPPKKLAVVSDLAGYGRCSLTETIPIVSQLGVQCCPVPTAVFSNHTGYPAWHMADYTPELPAYLAAWKGLGFTFDGILTGFLSNQAQADLIRQFLTDFKKENTLYILDPAMGDNGRAYATCGDEIQQSMRELVSLADVITPNVTEACILTRTPYRPDFTKSELTTLACRLLSMGPKQVVITGIPCKSFIGNLCVSKNPAVPGPDDDSISIRTRQDKDRETENQCLSSNVHSVLLRTRKVSQSRHGTGDIFSAILAAELLKGTAKLRKGSPDLQKGTPDSREEYADPPERNRERPPVQPGNSHHRRQKSLRLREKVSARFRRLLSPRTGGRMF
ncbi:MAG: bifunctional hydroxymethylpyrimidine kinase/phosphomethylpyrimidine kinase [Lachnospiraceae bacterium]|nr:bifunctional hydroxymethylpyrimidine kinase/phosphomethylpyrimidine kinase [Lachnospiraceae bacterium]